MDPRQARAGGSSCVDVGFWRVLLCRDWADVSSVMTLSPAAQTESGAAGSVTPAVVVPARVKADGRPGGPRCGRTARAARRAGAAPEEPVG